jgi:hypothetical protein
VCVRVFSLSLRKNLSIRTYAHTYTHTHNMSLADIVAKLPLDILHIIAKYMRTQEADSIANCRFRWVSKYTEYPRAWTWAGNLYVNPNGTEYYRRGTPPCNHHRHSGFWFEKTDIALYQGGHLNRRLMDQARDQTYSFPKMTPRKEAEWVRGQLALNSIHLPAHTHRKTMWKLFMALD